MAEDGRLNACLGGKGDLVFDTRVDEAMKKPARCVDIIFSFPGL